MKLHCAVLIAIVSLGYLSGCAYIDGRKAQQQAAVEPSTKVHHTTPANVTTNPPLPNAAPTPAAATAARIIAPLTQ